MAGTVRGVVVGVVMSSEASSGARDESPSVVGVSGDLALDSVLARSDVVRSPSLERGMAEGAMAGKSAVGNLCPGRDLGVIRGELLTASPDSRSLEESKWLIY